MRQHQIYDAQAALGFLVSQITYIETQIYQTRYPDIQYAQLIPVDTSAPEWTKSVTFFSIDQAGEAAWFHAAAKDIPLADVERNKFEQGIEMAAIGYRYNLEELGQAMMVPGTNLTLDRANAAKRAYEQFVDTRALRGDPDKNWTGLFNDPNVVVLEAAAVGTGSSAEWADKTGAQIANDINAMLTGVYVVSKTVEMADTLLLPVEAMTLIATKPFNLSGGSDMSTLEWIKRYNVYTQVTGQQLTIKAVRGLESAGSGSVARAVAYRRDPQVLKLHLPMPHRFLPVWQTGPLTFDIPGIFRFGGTEIRLPLAVRYMDGIADAVS